MCWWLLLCERQTAGNALSPRRPTFPEQPDRRWQSSGVGRAPAKATGEPQDQDASDTIGFGIGLGVGLETPLIDSLLERLLRRKQILMAAAAAAAAASAYPGAGGWGSTGAGYYPGALYPFGGGGGVLANPWNRPAYPSVYPFVPPIGPFGGGAGNAGGWGPFDGGFNPLFGFDNDFAWKNNPK